MVFEEVTVMLISGKINDPFTLLQDMKVIVSEQLHLSYFLACPFLTQTNNLPNSTRQPRPYS